MHGTSRVVYSQSFVSGKTSAVDQYGTEHHVAGLIRGHRKKARAAPIAMRQRMLDGS